MTEGTQNVDVAESDAVPENVTIVAAKAALQAGDNGQAIGLFRKAIGQDKTVAEWHALLGKSLMRAEVWATARDSYLKAIECDPDSPFYYHALGVIYTELDAFKDARAAFEESLRLNPDLSRSYIGLARLFAKWESPEQALVCVDKAIEQAPQNSNHYAEKAYMLMAAGRNHDAATAYEMALDIAPKNPLWLRRMSTLMLSLERWDDAIAAAKEALTLEPNNIGNEDFLDVARGRHPDFSQSLKEKDGDGKAPLRFYIAGCARSGGWLLENALACFPNISRQPRERHFGYFSKIGSDANIHVIKRYARAREDLHLLPESIALLYVVRHPFDVLTSCHIDINYYVQPERWREEVASLRKIMDRPNSLIFKFEDFVTNPDSIKEKIEQMWDIKAGHSFKDFMSVAKPTDFVERSMNGIRAFDPDHIDRYLKDPKHVAYCRDIAPKLADDLQWMQERFGYEYPKEIIDFSAG